jgi:hypothetical protein
MDIDLLRRGDAGQPALVQLVEQCAVISDPSDGVIFEPTSVPLNPPVALTAKFQSDPVHVRQWAAFVRRIGEPALANDFSQVVTDLAEFLMPAAKAATTSGEHAVRWEPPGPWQRITP